MTSRRVLAVIVRSCLRTSRSARRWLKMELAVQRCGEYSDEDRPASDLEAGVMGSEALEEFSDGALVWGADRLRRSASPRVKLVRGAADTAI